MRLITIALLSSACATANCFAAVGGGLAPLGLDVEGGFFENNDSFTTYSGLASGTSDRLVSSARNVRQDHKFSWGLGLSHMLKQDIQVRGAFFINDHHFRDHLYAGAGSSDTVATLRLPSNMEKPVAKKAHAHEHMNAQISSLTLSKSTAYENITWAPRIGVARVKVKYEQSADYLDMDPSVSYQTANIYEFSKVSGVGLTAGTQVSYGMSSNWRLNAEGDFSLLSGEVRTRFQTKNDFAVADYNEKSKDKKETFQHIKAQFSVSRALKIFQNTLTMDLGYQYHVFPNSVKTLQFQDNTNSTVSASKLSDYSFAGIFVKFGMDIL